MTTQAQDLLRLVQLKIITVDGIKDEGLRVEVQAALDAV